MTALIRTQIVAARVHGLEFYSTAEDEQHGLSVALSSTLWDDLGRPDAITVTVEPGDRLN